jgi:hypothetical protein
MTDTKTTPKRASTSRPAKNVWTDEERVAMQASARERKAAAKRNPEDERAEGELEVRAKIADLPEPDRAMAERIYALVASAVPALVPRTYYGMPAWATEGKDGKVICFFKPKSKFKVRYASFEFQPDARLDDGEMWPVSFALTKLTAAAEKRIADLVKKAVG